MSELLEGVVVGVEKNSKGAKAQIQEEIEGKMEGTLALLYFFSALLK